MKIFISYSTYDKEVALTINYDLKELGIETLFDEERIKDIDDIDKYMKSIKNCDYVISLISINYIQSYYCMSEIAEIKDELEKKLIPIVLNSSQKILKKDPTDLNNYINFWNNKYKTLLKYNKNNSDNKINSALSQNITIEKELNNYLTIMNLIPKFIYKIQSTRCLDFSSLKKSDYKSLINHINSNPIIDFKKFKIFNLLNGYIKCFFYKLIFKKYNLTKTYLINIFLVTIILLSIFIIKFKYYGSSKSPDISNTTNLITSTSENIKTKEAGTKSTSKSVEITNNTTKTDSPNKKKFSDNKSIDNNDSTYTTSPNNSKTNISELPTTTTVPTKERIEPTKEVSVKSSRVTLLNKTLVENNSVGNEWDVQIFINNKILDSNVVLLDTDEITAHIKVTENDKKPDTAEKTIGLKKGLTTFNITVKENLGRYSGNTATWAFKFQVE